MLTAGGCTSEWCTVQPLATARNAGSRSDGIAWGGVTVIVICPTRAGRPSAILHVTWTDKPVRSMPWRSRNRPAWNATHKARRDRGTTDAAPDAPHPSSLLYGPLHTRSSAGIGSRRRPRWRPSLLRTQPRHRRTIRHQHTTYRPATAQWLPRCPAPLRSMATRVADHECPLSPGLSTKQSI